MALVFSPPSNETPGYLRRMRQALSFQEKLTTNPTANTVDELVDFLMLYVTEPEDKAEARELLLDASQAQFMELLTAITGDNETNPT